MQNTTRFAAGRKLDVICLGRFAVDFYAQQIGARLEDVASFAKYLGGSSANTAFGCARLDIWQSSRHPRAASFAKYLGGSSANTAFGCARLGLKAAMANAVLADEPPRY